MKLSRKTGYALRALTELAEHAGQGALQAQELARREQIPPKFLEQILLELRRAGMVHSRRGAGRGYALSLQPGQISVADVVALIEGPVALVSERPGPAAAGPVTGACGLPAVMAELSAEVCDLLGGVSVADIQARSAELRAQAGYVGEYSI